MNIFLRFYCFDQQNICHHLRFHMQYKFTKKTYCLIWAVAALFFSVLVSHTVLPQYFEVVSPLTNIEIEATASKKSPS